MKVPSGEDVIPMSGLSMGYKHTPAKPGWGV